jgi:tRNA(Ile)-lysidine synthase
LTIETQFSFNIHKLFPKQLPSRIAVAVSGGLDSMALLLLLKDITGNTIHCLTVDHDVRENSAQDANFVANFCSKHSIPCTILKSYLQTPPEADIENSLRQVRYNLFEGFCQKNKIKHLFIAHHRQDLAENFLIRLFRGSGIDGLASMGVVSFNNKIQIIRPLLYFSKNDLKQYLLTKKASWVEDETNENEKFLRNKVRKFIESLPDFNVINDRIALASNAMLEAKEILSKDTKKNFPKIFKKFSEGFILDITRFKKLEKSVATRYLGMALMEVSQREYKPRLKKLERIYWLIADDELKQKEGCYGCILEKRNSDEIFIFKKE